MTEGLTGKIKKPLKSIALLFRASQGKEGRKEESGEQSFATGKGLPRKFRMVQEEAEVFREGRREGSGRDRIS